MNEKDKPLTDRADFVAHMARFGLEIERAHEKAILKHPMMGFVHKAETFAGDSTNELSQFDKQMLRGLQLLNDTAEQKRRFTWRNIFDEEVLEAIESITAEDWYAAQAELVQVAQVAFRAWLWCEEQKQKQETKKGE